MKTILGVAAFVFVGIMAILATFHYYADFPKPIHKDTTEYLESRRQIMCVADNIYYEAGNQSIVGKKAVAYVTLNRMVDSESKWPTDACEVVYQRTNRQSVCQFSWVCGPRRPKENETWELSYNIAHHVWHQYDRSTDPTDGATFFHATYVRPQWNYQKTVQIGDHIFYK